MLTHNTLDTLCHLKLTGMSDAWNNSALNQTPTTWRSRNA